MNKSNQYFLQIHLAVLLFGAAGLFGKLITVSSGAIVLGRAFLGALFLMTLKISIGEGFKIARKDFYIFALLGLTLAFHWIAFFESIQQSTVAIGVLTFSTFPVFTSLLEPLVDREEFRKQDLLLALIAFAGVALVIPSFDLKDEYTIGALWGITSGASFAILALTSRRMIKTYSSNSVSFYQNFIAALILFPFFFEDIMNGNQQDWIYLIILGVIFTGIAHTLFINSMKGMKAQTASLIACLEPFYAIILAWIILNETPTLRMSAGGLLILAVATYATLSNRKSKKSNKKTNITLKN